MANFDGLAQIALNTGFKQRVQYALVVAAQQVYAEDPATPSHTVRTALAVRVINGQYPDLFSVALNVLANPSIAAMADTTQPPDFSIPDGTIQFAVNSIWNDLAGV